MTKKIEQEELDNLKSLSERLSELKSIIADCEVQIVRANRMKDSSVSEIEKVALDLSNVQASLREKYGDITVNLKTGEYNG